MQVDAIYHGTAERAKCVPSSLGAHGNVELGSSKADSRQIGRKGESELKRGEGGGYRGCLATTLHFARYLTCSYLQVMLAANSLECAQRGGRRRVRG